MMRIFKATQLRQGRRAISATSDVALHRRLQIAVQLAIQKFMHALDSGGAIEISRRHDDANYLFFFSTGVSSKCGRSQARSFSLARAKRDMTVPISMPSRSLNS